MAATGLQMNWTAVSFASTTLVRVDNVSFDLGGTLISYSGDTDRFPTVIVNNMNAPRAQVTTSNPAQVIGLAPGTTGTFTATHKDAKGAVGGDIVYTLINAVVASPSAAGGHAQFGNGQFDLQAFSADGTTNPLSFARS